MNNEIIYLHHPKGIGLNNFYLLSERDLKEIDDLAILMQQPDSNLNKLLDIWSTKKEWRLLIGSLL